LEVVDFNALKPVSCVAVASGAVLVGWFGFCGAGRGGGDVLVAWSESEEAGRTHAWGAGGPFLCRWRVGGEGFPAEV
jgi:hypothetical protein